MPTSRMFALTATVVLSWVSILAEQQPGPPDPPVPRVTVSKKGADVTLTWTAGRPPFLVVREAPLRSGSGSMLTYPAEKVVTRTFIDRNVPEGDRYWYRVFDANAKPEIFAISPTGTVGPGDQVLITGVGFSDNCNDIHIDQGGESWRPYQCSFTELRLRVPGDIVNGTLILTSPTGTAFEIESGWKRDKAKTW